MRPIAIDQRALRHVRNELDSVHEDLVVALGDVDHPAGHFPWHDLLVDGVRGLVEDSAEIANRCRNLAGAIDDSLIDFDHLDTMVGQAAGFAAQLDQVVPR